MYLLPFSSDQPLINYWKWEYIWPISKSIASSKFANFDVKKLNQNFLKVG